MKSFLGAMVIVSMGSMIFVGTLRAQGIKEGQWSMTMVTRMGGQENAQAMKEMENMSPEDKALMQQMMGGMNIQLGGNSAGMTTTITKCITNQDPVPGREGDEDCKKTHTIDGNTVNFEEICPDSKSTGRVTYEEDSMGGVINSHQTVDGKETDVTIDIKGRYTGPCS